MGEFIKAKYAWMIPTSNGVVLEDNPNAAGMLPIYQIPVEDVESFKDKWDIQDLKFIPLYGGVTQLPSPEVVTKRKKNERSK